MAWYDIGSISVTNGSATVTGSGTDFISGVQVGEGLYIGGDLYEIGVINSSTQLTLSDAYLGSTATGQAYKIIPTQSLVADLSSGVANLISDFADVRDYAGNGKFNDGTQASPAITFTQDQNNGLYRIGSDNWGLAAGGAKALEIKTTGVKLDDGKKITFGASDDLQIYHDGSNSYVKDSGTGNLWVQGASQVNIGGANGTIGVQVNEGSSTALRHNNSVKLTTTSTGVDVTGTITADGLTVDGLPTVELTATDGTLTSFDASDSTTLKVSARIAGQNFSNLQIASDALRNQYIWNNYANADLTIGKRGSVGGSNKNTSALKIANNGNVSFYEDTGTTAKMVWDASAESLGIGTASPEDLLHVNKNGAGEVILAQFENGTNAGGTSASIKLRNHTDVCSTVLESHRNGANFGADFVIKTSNGVSGTIDERFRITEAGNVGIGTASPTATLDVRGSAYFISTGGTRTTDTPNGNGVEVIGGATNNMLSYNRTSASYLPIRYRAGVQSWEVNNSEAMRIDSAGNVGIGTASPDVLLEVVGADPVLTIRDTETAGSLTNATLRLAETGAGDALNNHWDISHTGGSALAFKSALGTTASEERARIDSSGNLLVGTTSTTVGYDSADSGIALRGQSGSLFSRSNSFAISANRNGTDGDIVEFRKDGTGIGSIGVDNTDNLYITGTATNHGGVMFGTNEMIPYQNDAITDGAVNIGQSAYRFKDLYLSGGVYLGGTGAVNKLDDYEEGNWTPDLAFGGLTTGITYNPSYRFCSYTKVGRTVTCRVGVLLTSKGTATGAATIGGLPFTVKSLSYRDATCTMGYGSMSGMGTAGAIGIGRNGTNLLDLRQYGDGSVSPITDTNFTNNTFIYATFVYDTDQ